MRSAMLLRRDEAGVVMVMAVVLSSVVATLAALMLTVGSHTDKATAQGRHRTQSLHVAESGIEHAIARIEEEQGALAAVTTFTGATEIGEYEVTITRQPRNRYLIESTGGVRAGRQLGAERKIQILLAPPVEFDKALFSFTTVETKNNDIIDGDIWANHNAILASGTTVRGDVIAATGYISVGGGSIIEGEAWSGGFNAAVREAITLENNARVDGNATASVVTVGCAGADNADYKVRVNSGATIGGNVRTWGSIQGSGTILGTISTNTCSQSPPTEPLPTFTYSASNYDPATLHQFGTPGAPSATAVSDFQAYIAGQGHNISGAYYVNQSTPVGQNVRIDLTGVTIMGDTTIVTNTPVFTNGVDDDPSVTDAIFTLVSTYDPPAGSSCDVNQDNSECSIHLKNNFSVSGATAVLVFSPFGPTAVKNNAEQFGTIYADSIQVKNNQEMTYDARVDRVVGFGDVTFEIVEWQEVVV